MVDRAAVTAFAELALQFTGFRNVDLFSQGIYQIRARAHGARSGRAAVPFATSKAAADASVAAGSTANRDEVLPAHILDGSGDFCSPAFRVRYCDEEVILRTLGRLRIELSLDPAAADAADAGADAGADAAADADAAAAAASGSGGQMEAVLLEFRLMHARSTTAFDAEADVEAQSLEQFSVVATQTLRVELPLRGGASFFPLTFDDWHFCFAPLVVHAALLEYRRATPANAAQFGATPRNSAQLRAIRRNSPAQFF